MPKSKLPKPPDFESLSLVPSTVGQIIGHSSPMAGQLVSQVGVDAVNKAAEEYQKAAQEAARKAQEEAMREAQRAQERAAQQAQEAARRRAEEAQRQAQEAARRQAEEAQRRAQEAQQEAAQEAQQQAQQNAQQAQEQATQQSQQATQQAQDAQQQAAEEAQRQAAEQAQRAQQQAARQATDQMDANGQPRQFTPAVATNEPGRVKTPNMATNAPGRVMTPSSATTPPTPQQPTQFWPDPSRRPPMTPPGELPNMQQATNLPNLTQPSKPIPTEQNPIWTAIQNRGLNRPGLDPRQIAAGFATGNDSYNIGADVARMAWADEKRINWRQNPTVLASAPQDYIESWLGMWRASQAGAPLSNEARRELVKIGLPPTVSAPTPRAYGGPAEPPARANIPSTSLSAYPYSHLPIPQQIEAVTGTSRGLINNLLAPTPQPPTGATSRPALIEPPSRGNLPSMNRPGAVPTAAASPSTPSAPSWGPSAPTAPPSPPLPPSTPSAPAAAWPIGSVPQDADGNERPDDMLTVRSLYDPSVTKRWRRDAWDAMGDAFQSDWEVINAEPTPRRTRQSRVPPAPSGGSRFTVRHTDEYGPVVQAASGNVMAWDENGRLIPLESQGGMLLKAGSEPELVAPDGMPTPAAPSRLAAVSNLAPLTAANYSFFSQQQGGTPTPDIRDDMVRNLSAAIVTGEKWAEPAMQELGRLAWYRESGGRQGLPEQAPESYVRNWIGAFRAGEDVTLSAEINEQLAQTGQTETPQSRRLQRQGGSRVEALPIIATGNRVEPTTGLNVADIAQRYAGGRYHYGGGRDGRGYGVPGQATSDCSAFVSAVWKENGLDLLAHTDSALNQLRRLGAAEVKPDQAQPGDVVFYMGAGSGGALSHHMGIYAGAGRVLDQSTSNGGGVKLRNIDHGGHYIILRDPRMQAKVPEAAQQPRAPATSQQLLSNRASPVSQAEPANLPPIEEGNPARYFATAGHYARQVERETGIPAALSLAVSANETGYGQRRYMAGSNNYHGIQAKPGEPGSVPYRDWRPGAGGQKEFYNAAQRSFATPLDGFRGFARFLLDNQRYKPALESYAQTNDVEQLARDIHRLGYAEDPQYSNKIIRIMRGIPVPTGVGDVVDTRGVPLR